MNSEAEYGQEGPGEMEPKSNGTDERYNPNSLGKSPPHVHMEAVVDYEKSC